MYSAVFSRQQTSGAYNFLLMYVRICHQITVANVFSSLQQMQNLGASNICLMYVRICSISGKVIWFIFSRQQTYIAQAIILFLYVLIIAPSNNGRSAVFVGQQMSGASIFCLMFVRICSNVANSFSYLLQIGNTQYKQS